MENYQLIDNTEEKQYEFHVDGMKPKIEYLKSDRGQIILSHTEVPRQLEGQGIGTKLVKSVLTDIDKKGLRLIPLCPFVIAYINRNPEWSRLVD